MHEIYDLHCHSSASDGALAPAELVRRAAAKGVTSLALTDHDTTAGLDDAKLSAEQQGIKLIPGIEISTTWENKCFHIVGLNFDPDNQNLQQGLSGIQAIRQERAKKIAEKLSKKKIHGAYEAVTEAAGTGMITRIHFAEFLLQNNHVASIQDAFDKYLAQGKPAYVSTQWADLDTALGWLNDAGGVAVLAHPLRYNMTNTWIKRFLTSFKNSGGQSIEVVTGNTNTDEIHRSSKYAQQFSLYGSVGSDFHSPANTWVELGKLAPLPKSIRPVWELF